jgi:hypothetical protein
LPTLGQVKHSFFGLSKSKCFTGDKIWHSAKMSCGTKYLYVQQDAWRNCRFGSNKNKRSVYYNCAQSSCTEYHVVLCDCLSIRGYYRASARRPHVPVAAHASPSACCEAPTPNLHRQNGGCEISPSQIVITAPHFRPVLKIWTDTNRTKVRHHMVLSRFATHTRFPEFGCLDCRMPNFTTVRASGQPGALNRFKTPVDRTQAEPSRLGSEAAADAAAATTAGKAGEAGTFVAEASPRQTPLEE